MTNHQPLTQKVFPPLLRSRPKPRRILLLPKRKLLRQRNIEPIQQNKKLLGTIINIGHGPHLNNVRVSQYAEKLHLHRQIDDAAYEMVRIARLVQARREFFDSVTVFAVAYKVLGDEFAVLGYGEELVFVGVSAAAVAILFGFFLAAVVLTLDAFEGGDGAESALAEDVAERNLCFIYETQYKYN